MAEVIDELPKYKVGPEAKYPWEQWFDGQVWKLTKGADFLTNPESFRRTAGMAAARMHVHAETRVVGDVLFLQASRG